MIVTRTQILQRGLTQRCPNCGHKTLFPPRSFRVHRRCPDCGTGFDRGEGFFLGPWVLYFGYEWDTYLNRDYSTLYPGPNLREKILSLDGISGIRILRRMSGKKITLIQLTDSVIRLYNGMPLRAIQWESPDGFVVQGKIITSIVPQPRSDADGQTGIVIGSVP